MRPRRSSTRVESRGGSPRSPTGVVLPLLLVLAVALATFVRALGNGFVWDDKLILSKQLSAFPTLGHVFFPPANIPQYSPFYYRPMVVLTYLVDRTLGGGSPVPFHATPILLHALVSCLALLLFRRLLGPNATVAAIVGALAFAVHPVHTEVAAWMAGRGDAIAAVGVLVALLSWGRWLDTRGLGRGWRPAPAGSCSDCSARRQRSSVHRSAAALPWVWPRQGRRRMAKLPLLWGAILVAVVLYVVLRASGPGFAPGVTHASPAGAVDVLGTLGFYAAIRALAGDGRGGPDRGPFRFLPRAARPRRARLLDGRRRLGGVAAFPAFPLGSVVARAGARAAASCWSCARCPRPRSPTATSIYRPSRSRSSPRSVSRSCRNEPSARSSFAAGVVLAVWAVLGAQARRDLA